MAGTASLFLIKSNSKIAHIVLVWVAAVLPPKKCALSLWLTAVRSATVSYFILPALSIKVKILASRQPCIAVKGNHLIKGYLSVQDVFRNARTWPSAACVVWRARTCWKGHRVRRVIYGCSKVSAVLVWCVFSRSRCCAGEGDDTEVSQWQFGTYCQLWILVTRVASRTRLVVAFGEQAVADGGS